MSGFVRQKKKRKDPGIRKVISVISVKKDPTQNKSLKNPGLFPCPGQIDNTGTTNIVLS